MTPTTSTYNIFKYFKTGERGGGGGGGRGRGRGTNHWCYSAPGNRANRSTHTYKMEVGEQSSNTVRVQQAESLQRSWNPGLT